MKEYSVYILRCSDGTYYTGVTNNIEERFAQHQEGVDPRCFTYQPSPASAGLWLAGRRRPLELVFVESFREINDAIEMEKKVQKWSRAKKEALINQNFERLPELARKRNFARLP